ncbi:hypothetical protein ACFYWN_10700 [Streptomyces sp. NPDC002917]|uniref:hypothetical protein n=1 Tax=unclassified Streptomyces TaxID=2593676 RepID=UPI0033A73B87|nr:hypothetical protein OH719_21195 [Streptomyces sp. NBC_01653]WTD90706.1 hypothetical protein OG891_25685 [Streptomyces sp. NBC_01637]
MTGRRPGSIRRRQGDLRRGGRDTPFRPRPLRTSGGAPDLDGSGSPAAMVCAVMKTNTAVMKIITDKGYAVARPEDYV